MSPDADQHRSRYFLKDHLGSTRVIVDELGTHLASFDYYPFGLEMPDRSSSGGTGVDTYKYTGHERDGETGINIDYMLARGYNPVVVRFMQVDPLADMFPEWTSYHYVHNNLFTSFRTSRSERQPEAPASIVSDHKETGLQLCIPSQELAIRNSIFNNSGSLIKTKLPEMELYSI